MQQVLSRLLIILCFLYLTRGSDYSEEDEDVRFLVKRQANYYYYETPTTLAPVTRRIRKKCPTNAMGKIVRCRRKKKKRTTTVNPVIPPSWRRAGFGINPIGIFVGNNFLANITATSTAKNSIILTTSTTKSPSGITTSAIVRTTQSLPNSTINRNMTMISRNVLPVAAVSSTFLPKGSPLNATNSSSTTVSPISTTVGSSPPMGPPMAASQLGRALPLRPVVLFPTTTSLPTTSQSHLSVPTLKPLTITSNISQPSGSQVLSRAVPLLPIPSVSSPVSPLNGTNTLSPGAFAPVSRNLPVNVPQVSNLLNIVTNLPNSLPTSTTPALKMANNGLIKMLPVDNSTVPPLVKSAVPIAVQMPSVPIRGSMPNTLTAVSNSITSTNPNSLISTGSSVVSTSISTVKPLLVASMPAMKYPVTKIPKNNLTNFNNSLITKKVPAPRTTKKGGKKRNKRNKRRKKQKRRTTKKGTGPAKITSPFTIKKN